MQSPDITICSGIKDRSDFFIKHVLGSMNDIQHKERLALSIFDCGSTDIGSPENLRKIIEKKWQGELVFRTEETNFARAFSFNRAVEQATTEKVFLCDADMVLPRDFVQIFDVFVGPGSVWFPTCFSLKKNAAAVIDKNNGYWRSAGHGMVGIYKSVYLKLGGLDEQFTTYGKEDDHFYTRVWRAGYRSEHGTCDGLFHVWHESEHGHH